MAIELPFYVYLPWVDSIAGTSLKNL